MFESGGNVRQVFGTVLLAFKQCVQRLPAFGARLLGVLLLGLLLAKGLAQAQQVGLLKMGLLQAGGVLALFGLRPGCRFLRRLQGLLQHGLLLAEPGLFKQDNGTAVRHEAAWQASYTRSQNASVKARITTTSTPHGKRRQLEVDFRIEADLQPETVKGAELFLIRLLKRHFPHGSIAASWRADLGDQGVWYGDTQFAYNLIQPGVAGLHPQVHAGLVEHFSEPRWRLI